MSSLGCNKNQQVQLYALHLVELRLRDHRLYSEVEGELSEKQWWLEYLDDTDLRQSYAQMILSHGTYEWFEEDEDVVAFYDSQYEQYIKGHDFTVTVFW